MNILKKKLWKSNVLVNSSNPLYWIKLLRIKFFDNFNNNFWIICTEFLTAESYHTVLYILFSFWKSLPSLISWASLAKFVVCFVGGGVGRSGCPLPYWWYCQVVVMNLWHLARKLEVEGSNPAPAIKHICHEKDSTV